MASASRSNPCRVLLVEDDDMLAALIAEMFELDARVRLVGRACHGSEALTMAAALDPDVILMDLEMPVMDGVEATRRLRDLRSRARIVVLTGVEDARRIREARQAGADTFVTKVPTADELARVVLGERPAA